MYLEISNPMDYHAALYIRLSKEDDTMRLYTSDYQRRMKVRDHPRAFRTRNPCCGSSYSSIG